MLQPFAADLRLCQLQPRRISREPHRLCRHAGRGRSGPIGSGLGGTGIAVSAFSANREAAIDFAYWVASGLVQADRYWRSGGQPGHAAGWEDEGANTATLGFYRNTRRTLEGAWLRPRHDGYMPFQEAASHRINAALTSREPAAKAIADLNDLFLKSFR